MYTVYSKRYQPKSSPFTPIDTENAHLLICKTCRPSAVMDVGFTNALFVQVLEFFMYNRLDLWDRKMEKIPIHLVSTSFIFLYAICFIVCIEFV